MKLFNLLSKIFAIVAIFVGPSIIVIKRYAKESTTQVVTTSSGIGLIPTVFIIAIIAVGLWFVSNQLSEMIRQSNFGWLAILFFGLFLGLSLFGVWFIFNSIVLAVQTNVAVYANSMIYHRKTVFYMLYPIGGGIAWAGLSKLIGWKIFA